MAPTVPALRPAVWPVVCPAVWPPPCRSPLAYH